MRDRLAFLPASAAVDGWAIDYIRLDVAGKSLGDP